MRSPTVRIAIATAALFALSPLIAHGSLGSTALLSMLPFAALLGLAAVAQMLVIQQAGFDLSIPGVISLAALLICMHGDGGTAHLVVAALLIPLAMSVVGLLTGIVVVWLRVTPIVATLGMNTLLIGTVQALSNGYSRHAPKGLSTFVLDKVVGVPVLAWIALVVVLLIQLIGKSTLLGRRLELVGAGAAAARAAGLSVDRYKVIAYMGSAALAGLAGVLLAGFVSNPPLSAGDSYLLPSVTAVVLGGVALSGGQASAIGTLIGALFLGQLTQLVVTRGGGAAEQDVIQAVIIGVGVAVQFRLAERLRSRGKAVVQPDDLETDRLAAAGPRSAAGPPG